MRDVKGILKLASHLRTYAVRWLVALMQRRSLVRVGTVDHRLSCNDG